MSLPDDLYTFNYDEKSLSGRMDKAFNLKSARKIMLPPPADFESAFPTGLPNYHPSAMPHAVYHQFKLKPAYVPPLTYYVLQALRPHYDSISPLDKLLSSQVSAGTERVGIVDSLLPYAKDNMDHVDPGTWAVLIQSFHSLPERCFKYTLALNDPHLTTLSTIPPTPTFSVVTFLDLSARAELYDGNVSLLKVLTGLCVFDASCTALTDQGVKNLASTLFLREPGPVYLRSWSLRRCAGVTFKALESLLAFPLLCVLDLRETRARPAQLKGAFWPQHALLPILEHAECFAPYPQHRIPALLQKLEKSAFLHSRDDVGAQEPYVIHVDRVRPRARARSTSRAEGGVSQIARNAYHVSGTYVQPAERPETSWSRYDRYQASGEDGYDGYEYEGADCSEGGWFDSEHHGDSDSVGSAHEDGSDSNSVDTVSTEGLVETLDFPDAYREPGLSSPTTTHTVRSSSPPMLDLLTSEPVPSTASPVDSDESAETNGATRHPDPSTIRRSPELPLARDVVQGVLELSDDDSSDGFLDEIFERQSQEAGRAIPGFFNARVQAGLAPPKRKRTARGSSESLNSDAPEDEPRKREMNLSSLGDVELLVLRRPPSWTSVENLIADKQKSATVTSVQSRNEGGTNKPESPIARLAKKRKVAPDGAMAAWNRIKAASSTKPTQSNTTPLPLPITDASPAPPQIRPPPALPQPPQGQDKPVRRTTLGRAPRPPGTVPWKSK